MPRSHRVSLPRRAMVLAAGLGQRMRPLTDRVPKPLIPVRGRPLIDHVLDRLSAVGVECAVVNVHHFADQMERHLGARREPRIVISDERDRLLGTGGGALKALSTLGTAPFFHVNSDSIWIISNENSRPMTDPIWAISLPTEMRSRRDIRDE